MIEREVKLGVWPGFELPDLDGVVEGITSVPQAERRLDATYHDTADLRLAREGITLRHRTGDEPAWTLKLPLGGIARDELPFVGERGGVPAEIAALLTARVRTATLGPVARLQTVRTPFELVDDDGKRVAEVVDDEVSVLEGRHVALRFREVEVELADEVPAGLLDEVLTRLRIAGAGLPDPTPKVIRALGPRAVAPPDLVVPEIGEEASAAQALAVGMARSVRRLVDHDLGIRLRAGDEHVHQARVATRRLRSDLRTYRELLEPTWATSLRDELAWLADALGNVRDADVLAARLTARAPMLEARDRPGLGELLAVLEAAHDEAREELGAVLVSRRYAELVDRLVDAATAPRTLPDAEEPASVVLPRLAARPWASLAKAAGRVKRTSPDARLHEVRIRAKRARYAADVAALVLGKPARRLAEAVAGVQEVLGEHQDAVVARDWLREAAAASTPRVAMVAGQLMAIEQRDADAARAEWPSAWRKADEGRLRTWLRP